jgi:hypothetical protein
MKYIFEDHIHFLSYSDFFHSCTQENKIFSFAFCCLLIALHPFVTPLFKHQLAVVWVVVPAVVLAECDPLHDLVSHNQEIYTVKCYVIALPTKAAATQIPFFVCNNVSGKKEVSMFLTNASFSEHYRRRRWWWFRVVDGNSGLWMAVHLCSCKINAHITTNADCRLFLPFFFS